MRVFATNYGWARAHNMRRKGEVHKTLSALLHHDGVPPIMIYDDSKEQHSKDFQQKLNEANCHLRMTEPYSPWQQAAEGCIRELKRGVTRKMVKTGSPKPLWDHCQVWCTCMWDKNSENVTFKRFPVSEKN
jgi:hypothetical protein